MNIYSRSGFTLIELLVVIAIIGILAATVLASLGTARQSANDASVKQQLSSIRSQAEIYYTNNANSYEGVYNASSTAPIRTATPGILFVNGNDSVTAWAAAAPLPGVGGTAHWCVDSTGVSKQIPSALGGSATVCP